MSTAMKSKWKRAGFLVRNVTTTRDVATTGLEVLDGKGLPIKSSTRSPVKN